MIERCSEKERGKKKRVDGEGKEGKGWGDGNGRQSVVLLFWVVAGEL